MGCASLPIGAETYQEHIYTTDATSDEVVKAGVASKNIYVTDYVVSTSVDVTLEIKDSPGNETFFILFLPANSVWSKSMSVPTVVATGDGISINSTVAGDITVTIAGYVK